MTNANTTHFRERVSFKGPVSFTGAVELQADDAAGDETATGSISDEMVAGNANKRIGHAKIVQRLDLHYSQADGADVVTATQLLARLPDNVTLESVEVRPTVAPTGGDKQYTVEVQKAADGSGTWSSLLSAAVTVDSSSVDETKQAATLIGTPTADDGDALRVVVTASGSTGSQGQGVNVTITLRNEQ